MKRGGNSRFILLLTACLAPAQVSFPEPVASHATIRMAPDYAFLVGGADLSEPADGRFRWLVNGTSRVEGLVVDELLLPFDGGADGACGEVPTRADNLAFSTGKWGQALSLPTNEACLFHACAGNLNLAEGTAEMWLAPRAAGSASVYTGGWQVLLHYVSTNEDEHLIGHSTDEGILYGGGTVSGEWQSAYGSEANTRAWPSGEWHHIGFIWSAASNYLRFYLDGKLISDTGDDHFQPAPADAPDFAIGSHVWCGAPPFDVDDVHLAGRAMEAAEISARARRTWPCAANERWLDTSRLEEGDRVVYEFAPISGGVTGTPAASAEFEWAGIPLRNPSPGAELLPARCAGFSFSVQSREPAECRYALDAAPDFAAMTPFDAGAGSTSHMTWISGFDPNPGWTHRIRVRCSLDTNYLLSALFRCVPEPNSAFPRTGNLWGWYNFTEEPVSNRARIDVWLGCDDIRSNEAAAMRALHSNIVLMASINAVEWHDGLEESYYLHDTNGQRLLCWPGAYRLNLTKPMVAEFLAQVAVDRIMNSELLFDGVFFDNVFLTHSWWNYDIYGHPFHADADEDGQADEAAPYDAAWKAGVLHELAIFHERLPNAFVSGHAGTLDENGLTNVFNGVSIGFETANVLEKELPFSDLRSEYDDMSSRPRRPQIVMYESSPLDDIAYGFGYDPEENMPTSTWAFARDYHPVVRFGLAFTLLNDGYFAHEYGDIAHGQNWWYDELDYQLGYPLDPAEHLGLPGTNLTANSGFEEALGEEWNFWADEESGYTAEVVRVTDASAPEGAACARVTIAAALGTAWRIDVSQLDLPLTRDAVYEVSFQARADRPRPIGVYVSKNGPDWDEYGLDRSVRLETNWTAYAVRFTAVTSAVDARLEFLFGATNGIVWLDDVCLRPWGDEIYRREFDRGMVLLNATRTQQVIRVGPGYNRLAGNQAARTQYIVDDADAAFSATGAWSAIACDTEEWTATGPYYHDWGPSARQSAAADSAAQWMLSVPFDDTYTIEAWWPGKPANGWSTQVLYEVRAGGSVLAQMRCCQSTNGNRWNRLFAQALTAGVPVCVRAVAEDGQPFIADALHVFSAARYNDGTVATNVALAPMDGMVLRRDPFVEADWDGDGLPDGWEREFFDGPTNATALADEDGDCFDNRSEYLAGTDPTDGDSFFQCLEISSVDFPMIGKILAWPSASGRLYAVQAATNLSAGFDRVVTQGLAAVPPMNIVTNLQTGEKDREFYRIQVSKP